MVCAYVQIEMDKQIDIGIDTYIIKSLVNFGLSYSIKPKMKIRKGINFSFILSE